MAPSLAHWWFNPESEWGAAPRFGADICVISEHKKNKALFLLYFFALAYLMLNLVHDPHN
jgi:hypothetical protein